jgi:protein-tyrosine phosphatase
VPGEFTVLTVCHGNICRSPVAQYLLAEALGERFSLSSAGVGAVVGWPVHELMTQYLKADGIDPAGFAARQLDGKLIAGAELLLTMTRRQRAWIAEESPAAIKRTFTILEFARLAELVTAESVSELIRKAAAARAVYPPDDPAIDDIADPYGHPEEAFTVAYTEVKKAVERVKAVIEKCPELRSEADEDPFAGFVLK